MTKLDDKNMQELCIDTSGAMIPPDLTVPLPTAKDAIDNLCLPDGAGGLKRFKTHLGNLTRHSGFFAAAAREGTKLKVQEGGYELDCTCHGFDKLLEYMRKGKLPPKLDVDDLASLHRLGSSLNMADAFWRALALHPAKGGGGANGGANGGALCNGASGGGGGGGGGDAGLKGILKHINGSSGSKRRCAVAELGAAAPPPVAPRAKAYRRVLVEDMANPALCEQAFFNGEWYGQPAEMRVVDTYDAEAPNDYMVTEKSESSSDAKDCAQPPAEPPSSLNGGGKCNGCDGSAGAKAAEAQAAAAADALLGGQPPLHVRRFALLEFTFEAGSRCKA